MPPTPLSVATLGPLRVQRDGVEVALRPAQRRLLAVMLLAPDRTWRGDELIDRMWGEQPPDSARNALHVHLAGIRRALPGMVLSEPGGYRLAETGWHHDRAEFESSAVRCRAALARGEWQTVIDHGRRAMSLWRGDPLPELADQSDALVEIARLHEFRLSMLEAIGEALLEVGQTDLALAAARTAIADDELRERPRALAMLSLHRSGQQAAALREYREYRRVLGEATGLEPGPALRDLEERILLQDGTASAPTAPPHNLPRMSSAFVGRAVEMSDLGGELQTASLVTVVGTPGSGKTRLALEAARAQVGVHHGGVWLVMLGGATTEAAVTATVTTTLGTTDSVDGVASLAALLRPRPMLLVLDGCEPVLEPVRRLVAALGDPVGECRVLATSRLPLGVPGEVVLRLPTALAEADAVALLADRVRAIDRRFAVTPQNRAALEDLCARVEYNPLAVELVARWIPTLGVGDVTRLLDRMRTTGSLEAAFRWSRDLLAEEDRLILADLAGFAAPFTLERAAAVEGNRSTVAVAGSVARLVEASLLAAEVTPAATRYRMLDPIREMAWDTVGEDERTAIRLRHTAAMLADATDLELALRGPGQAEARRTLDTEMPDYRLALEHLRSTERWHDLARLAPALADYWYARFLGWEGRGWLDSIPRQRLDAAECIRVDQAAGYLAWAVHDYTAADAAYRRCLAAARRGGDRRGTAAALYGLGLIHQKRRFEDGAAMLEAAAVIYRTLEGCDLELGQCLLFRGIDEALNGDAARGEALLAEATEFLEHSGHLRQVSKAARWRAHAAWRLADHAAALAHATTAERIARDVDDHIALAGAQVELSNLAISSGDTTAAAEHLMAALAPVPGDDEVDRSQVLQPVARLALAQGDTDLAASLVAHIADVYERHGWRPLDDDPAARELRSRVGVVPMPDADELMREVEEFLRREARPGHRGS